LQMLKKVLEKSDGRATQLLRSMGSYMIVKQNEGEDSISVVLPGPQNKPQPRQRPARISETATGTLIKRFETVSAAHMATSAVSSTNNGATNLTAIDHSQANSHQLPTPIEELKIECRPCAASGPEGGARAFVMGPTPLSVVLCTNRLNFTTPEEVEQALTHELVHVYDVKVQKLDLQKCENLAYSEIRAAREGECANAWLGPKYCIKNCATVATQNLFPAAQARDCIRRKWDEAMQDTRPFSSKQQHPVAESTR